MCVYTHTHLELRTILVDIFVFFFFFLLHAEYISELWDHFQCFI